VSGHLSALHPLVGTESTGSGAEMIDEILRKSNDEYMVSMFQYAQVSIQKVLGVTLSISSLI
jgi:hypothetical protein